LCGICRVIHAGTVNPRSLSVTLQTTNHRSRIREAVPSEDQL
jgi:hypothetical protein